jgi:adenosylhomocysteine nucleosidase
MNDPGRHVVDIGDLAVLFVMATEQEYGPALRAEIDPLITGVGPVEAAAMTAAALSVLRLEGEMPDLVFSLGSAGSRTLAHAGVYQIASVAYRDMDATPLGFERGRTPFLDHPAVIPILHRIPGIPAASISTGGAIISGGAYDAIEADMVDMESFAIMRAAHRFDLPMIGLRGISDGRSDITGMADWTGYLHAIDAKLAEALGVFAEAVEGGSFSLDAPVA